MRKVSILLLLVFCFLINPNLTKASEEILVSLPLIQHELNQDEDALYHDLYQVIFNTTNSDNLMREELLGRIQVYISTIMAIQHYNNAKIGYWEVVSNALVHEAGEWTLRNSPWREQIGSDYISQLFQIAHTANPEANLYYADNGAALPGKAEAVYNLISQLQTDNVPIDGIVFTISNNPSHMELVQVLDLYTSLNLQISIKELTLDQFVFYFNALQSYRDQIEYITVKDLENKIFIITKELLLQPEYLVDNLLLKFLTIENLLTDKTLSASHEAQRAARLNDEILSTSWGPRAEPPYWITVDLGSEQILTNWTVYHRGSPSEIAGAINTSDFFLQASDDLTNWYDLDSFTDNLKSITNRRIPLVPARYLRLLITKPSSLDFNQDLILYEWEVHGVKFPDK